MLIFLGVLRQGLRRERRMADLPRGSLLLPKSFVTNGRNSGCVSFFNPRCYRE